MSPARQFSRHYTRDEARRLLPVIREWLATLRQLAPRLQKSGDTLERLLADGQDRGGITVEEHLDLEGRFRQVLGEFEQRQILIKDLQRGLVDFPAILDGREVFLCWEEGEKDIEFWHDLDAGYAGRERL